MIFVFLAPLMNWYITVPEIFYIIYAFFRGAVHDSISAQMYLWGLVLYYPAYLFNPTGTMVVTAILILVDFIYHIHLKHHPSRYAYLFKNDYTYDSSKYWDDDDDHSCPACGSGDYDGNHCYTCHKDF